jgi:hypothetical protein
VGKETIVVATPQPQRSTQQLSAVRILIVDDDIAFGARLKTILQRRGGG